MSLVFYRDRPWDDPMAPRQLPSGWYFWDETGSIPHGPFDDREDAMDALRGYEKCLNGDRDPMLTKIKKKLCENIPLYIAIALLVYLVGWMLSIAGATMEPRDGTETYGFGPVFTMFVILFSVGYLSYLGGRIDERHGFRKWLDSHVDFNSKN